MRSSAVAGRQLQATSVRHLYEEVLKILVEKYRVELDRLLPFSTSRERYLVASKPINPTANSFVVPVKYHGYYMEAHKDYKNASSHLAPLVAKPGLEHRYLG